MVTVLTKSYKHKLIVAMTFAVVAFPIFCRGALVINVHTGSGTYNGTAVVPDTGTDWNNIAGQSTASYTLSTVLNSGGNTVSGVSIAVSTTGSQLYAYSSANYGDPNPLNLMSGYFFGGNFTASISGLPAGSYMLYVFAHGNLTNQNSTVTWGSENGTSGSSGGEFRNLYTAGAAGYSYVLLTGAVTSSSNLTFTSTGYLNGFQLVQASAPSITGLANQTAYVGNTVVLSPTLAGVPVPVCQWFQNGVVMPGQTNSSLKLAQVQPNQNGYIFSLIATNSLGAATNSMTLTVATTPPMLVQSTLNLDVDKSSGTHYAGTAIASDTGTTWNSFVVPTGVSTYTLNNVVNSQGGATTSSITFARGSSFSVYDDASAADGNPNPVALMEDYLFGGNYSVTVSNLSQGTYSLFTYAHGNASGQSSPVALNVTNGGASGSTTDYGQFRNIYQTNAAGNSYVALTGIVGASGTFGFTVNYLNGFQLQLLTSPIVIGPTNETVVAGTTDTITPSTVTGVPLPICQWYSNNVLIAGATNTSLVLYNVQYAQNGTVYSIVATNTAGIAASSMALSVIVTPSIVNLNNQTVTPGTTVTMGPTVSGIPSPTLQWQFNSGNLTDGSDGRGSTISGSTTNTLNITNAQIADTGTYSLIASNSAGVVTNSMSLTVSSGTIAPAVTGPANQTVVQGSNATFSASVTGLPVPTLQWFDQTGTPIPGATSSSLTLSNISYSQNGYTYSLVASNSMGIVTNSANLYVLVPPTISLQPTNLTVVTGGPATFSITASGVPTVAYQWYQNGILIPNATGSTYTIASAQGSYNGALFSVTVSNSVGEVTSSNAKLTVLTASSEAFLPTNGAVNISPDQQLRIVFPGPPQLGSGKLYVYNAANNSLFATIDTSQFVTNVLWSAVYTNAEVRIEQGDSFYYMPIAIYGNQVWISLTNRFAYGQSYYVNCDAGLFLDASNNEYPAISGPSTWQFSTKVSGPAIPTASTGPTNITVALDGAGDFATLQGASDWIPQNNTLPRTITVQLGTYYDFTIFSQSRNNVNIFGAGANNQAVQIIYPYPAFSGTTNSVSGTLRLESSNIYVRNLTLDNQVYLTNDGVVFAGPINTLYTSGSELIFDNVLIKGGQDTVYTDSGITYFNHCQIWGSTDFIYGGALSVFDQCTIVEIASTGGFCTAPSTPYAQPYGLTFLNCTFPQAEMTNGYPYTCGPNNTYLMRPWGQDGMTADINCAMGNQITTEGWSTWDGRENTCRAREYGTTLVAGGTAPTIAQRQAAGAYWLDTINTNYTNPSMNPTNVYLTGSSNRVAITVDPSTYTLSAIYGNSYFGLNSWLPSVMPTIDTQPANQTVTNGTTVTFSAVATAQPAPSYQWLMNGSVLNGQTNATLTITNAQFGNYGNYSVVVSNNVGEIVSSNALLLVITEPVPPLPTIPNGTNIVTSFGAVGDGVTTNTTSIQAAINATSIAGGGTVEIPAGTYLCGPLTLSNSINLQIDAGAMLEMLPYGSYPASSDFISGSSVHDIEVTGGGIIDGQGAPWWQAQNNTPGGITRPAAMIAANACTNVLLQNITIQNSPAGHVGLRSGTINVTVNDINIENPPSPNTDGIDCGANYTLIENSHIEDGDDHVAMGGNHDVTIDNCLFGNGHGVSIGSFTTGGMSNLLVIDCIWTNGTSGIHLKSDDDRGGLVQNLRYINLAMTNTQIPIFFYSYYTNNGTSTGVSVGQATTYAAFPVTSTTPIWRNIVVSNLTAVPASGYPAGIIWGKPEMSFSNVTLDHVNVTASKYFELYNAQNIQLIDSQISASGTNAFGLYNATLIITNRSTSTIAVPLEGMATNGYVNSLLLYSTRAAVVETNLLAASPNVTLSTGLLTVNNNLALTPLSVYNYVLGTNFATMAVNGNLFLGGTINISTNSSFTNGIYTLMTYTGSLAGSGPTLGSAPPNFKYSISTSVPGQVNLVVAPTVNTTPTNLVFSLTGDMLRLNWPQDHLGWRLQIQTNNLNMGLGTNWVTVPGSTNVITTNMVINPANGTVFFRLIYP
jgi:polygalacturonase